MSIFARRGRRFLAAVAMTALASLAVPVPAHASAGTTAAPAGSTVVPPGSTGSSPELTITCTRGWFCIYAPGENPPHGEFQQGVYDLSGWNGGVLNDNVNWFWNLTDSNWCVYVDAGYSGSTQVVSPGYSGNLNNFGYSVSSLRVRPTFGC